MRLTGSSVACMLLLPVLFPLPAHLPGFEPLLLALVCVFPVHAASQLQTPVKAVCITRVSLLVRRPFSSKCAQEIVLAYRAAAHVAVAVAVDAAVFVTVVVSEKIPSASREYSENTSSSRRTNIEIVLSVSPLKG